MQPYSRLATPGFRRITLRFSGIEIELRTRTAVLTGRPTREERALRRACAERLLAQARANVYMRWTLSI